VEEAPTIGLERHGPSEAASFEAFFEAEHARLFGTLCLVTGDAREAEDVMQEAFLKLWERWDRVSTLDDPPAYLYRTAFNVFRSRRRRVVQAARRLAVREPEDPFAAVDAHQAVVAALRTLTPRRRAAVVLTDLMGLSSGEAAAALRVRPATVRVLASQGRAAMREMLEAQYE
jgi:RNA polymerase sigma-70 factor (ECF subfamily)